MKSSDVLRLHNLRLAVLDHQKNIALCQIDINDLEKSIEYQDTHKYDTKKTLYLINIQKARLEFLKAQKEMDEYELNEAQKTVQIKSPV
jgi:hypothetical protein